MMPMIIIVRLILLLMMITARRRIVIIKRNSNKFILLVILSDTNKNTSDNIKNREHRSIRNVRWTCGKDTCALIHEISCFGLASPPSPNQPRVPHLPASESHMHWGHRDVDRFLSSQATPQAMAERGRKASLQAW